MSACHNMSSPAETSQVIEDYLTKEAAAGNIFRLFSPSLLPSAHINRFGVIPKKYQLGKWRLITDLSYPEGSSVNDAIDPSLCSLSYTSVDVVAAWVRCSPGKHRGEISLLASPCFTLAVVHLPGSHNVLADDCSRNELHCFCMKFPESDTSPTSIPSSLLQWLSSTDLDWTSPAWIQLLNTIRTKGIAPFHTPDTSVSTPAFLLLLFTI